MNANQVPWTLTMVKANATDKKPQETVAEHGRAVYVNSCMTCHGKNREGSGSYPILQNISKKYSATQLSEIINNGRRMMPSFKQISEDDKKALLTFLLDLKKEGRGQFIASENKEVISRTEKSPFVPYTMTGYNKLRTREGYPANQPPWGTLTAINLNTGETMWHNPLGEYAELTKKGIPVTGTENYGGAVVTKGGLLFIAATLDGKLRAFNKRTGKLLWETSLPAAGFATPSTYEVNGKQYLVIACGGGKLDVPSGDSYVAFSLENTE